MTAARHSSPEIRAITQREKKPRHPGARKPRLSTVSGDTEAMEDSFAQRTSAAVTSRDGRPKQCLRADLRRVHDDRSRRCESVPIYRRLVLNGLAAEMSEINRSTFLAIS
jgi:hypothetical protein